MLRDPNLDPTHLKIVAGLAIPWQPLSGIGSLKAIILFSKPNSLGIWALFQQEGSLSGIVR